MVRRCRIADAPDGVRAARRIAVLYTFPHDLGRGGDINRQRNQNLRRIPVTAWNCVRLLDGANAPSICATAFAARW